MSHDKDPARDRHQSGDGDQTFDLNRTYNINELSILMDAADEAYRRVRSMIIDPLAGVNPDESDLTVCQRWALSDLRAAEAAIEEYRARNYATAMMRVPEQLA